MRDNDFTKILSWPGYRVFQHEIHEGTKRLRLWVRRIRRRRTRICSRCGKRVRDIVDVEAFGGTRYDYPVFHRD